MKKFVATMWTIVLILDIITCIFVPENLSWFDVFIPAFGVVLLSWDNVIKK